MDTALKELKRRVESPRRRCDARPGRRHRHPTQHPPATRPSGWSPPRSPWPAGAASTTAPSRDGRRGATGSRRVLRVPGLPGDRRDPRPDPDFAERLATGAGDLAAGVASLLRSLSRPPARRRAAASGASGLAAGEPAHATAAGASPRRGGPAPAPAGRAAARTGTRAAEQPTGDIGARPPVPVMMLTALRRRTSGGRDRAHGQADGPQGRQEGGAADAAAARTTTECSRTRGAAAVTLTIGVDVGGTKVAGGVVDADGTVLAQTRRDTPADDVGQDPRRDRRGGRRAGRRPSESTRSGIGAAGWIDAARSTVLFAPNLAWRDEPLRDYVPAARSACRSCVENDGNVAAWAEFRFGAARDADDSMVHVHRRHRHRRRHRARRRAGPRRATASPPSSGHMRPGAGRAPVRLRPARLPRAVRQRQRAGPVRPGRRRGRSPDRAELLLELAGGDAGGDHRPDGDRAPPSSGDAASRRRVRRRSATGWASAWPTWCRSSTRRCWWSAAA